MRYFKPHQRPTVFIFFFLWFHCHLLIAFRSFDLPTIHFWKVLTLRTVYSHAICLLLSWPVFIMKTFFVFLIQNNTCYSIINQCLKARYFFCWTILPHTMRVNNNNSLSFNWSEPTSTDFLRLLTLTELKLPNAVFILIMFNGFKFQHSCFHKLLQIYSNLILLHF
jgi:hypothetical protein